MSGRTDGSDWLDYAATPEEQERRRAHFAAQPATLALIDGVLPWVSESARRDLVKARDAVAELIEADKEYDDAQFGLARARYNGQPMDVWVSGCAKADIRRAAALAAMGAA